MQNLRAFAPLQIRIQGRDVIGDKPPALQTIETPAEMDAIVQKVVVSTTNSLSAVPDAQPNAQLIHSTCPKIEYRYKFYRALSV